MKLNKKIIIIFLLISNCLFAINSNTFFYDKNRDYSISYFIDNTGKLVLTGKEKKRNLFTIKSYLGFLSKKYSIIEDIDNDGLIDNILLFLDEKKSTNDFLIKIIYKNKICTIRHISSSLDCERYTKIDASFYRLPKIIQTRVLKLLTQMKSDTFLIDNDFKEDIKLHSLYLWDKSCLDFQIFKPWGERGIYPLKEEEIKSIIKARVRKKFDIKNSIPIVYKYRDKLGEQYLVIDSPYQSYSENYSKNMRIFNFIKKKNGLNLQWKLRDFSMNPIYVHMDNNMKDIDGDGLIDPIISYETESGFKIILFYKNRKIAIRANLEGDIEQLSINIDKRLYTIPFKIQEKVGKTIFNYVKIRSLPLAYAFDIKNRMKQKITRIKVNKMLLE